MVGRTILHYQFLEKLGAGGMGEIYKALDTRLNRPVAIKVLSTAARGDPDLRARQRFTQEAQAASALNHPHIITIHDILSEEGADFMVMEFVSGKTLVDLIPKGGLRGPQVLKYSVQMADALQAAHTAGIVHRDFKPGNVMVTESGFVKVLDFGLAKMADRGPLSAVAEDETKTMRDAPLTIEGSIIGTVSYMSPEQAQGKKVDTRSDIFSFGVVLYEMATGERAFQGDSTLTTLSAILRDEVRPIAEFAPEAPPQLEQVIRRCLKKSPDERWQTMKDVQMALTALKYESDSGRLYRARLSEPPPPPSGAEAGGGRRISLPGPALAGALTVVIALILAAIGGRVWWKQHHKAPPPIEQAAVATAPEAGAAAPAAPETPPTDAAAAPNTAAPADDGLTNDQIIQMVDGKVSPNQIIGQIRSSKTNFVMTPAELIRLSKASVPDAVIEAMRNAKRGAPSTPATPSTSASASAPTPASQGKPAPKETPPAPQPTVVAQPQEPPPASPPQPTPASAANSAAKAPTAPSQPATGNSKGSLTIVTLKDGKPFKITLAEDVPENAEGGKPVRFTASEDVREGDSIVIAKGAAVMGVIADVPGKKVLGFIGGGKLTFKLMTADGVDGHKFNIRAAQTRGSDGSNRPVELPNVKAKSKDLAASAGTEGYVAYLDGDQTVSVRK